MRPRNYSVLSKAEAEIDAPENHNDSEVEFLRELEDTIERMGSNRFTVDGKPVIVAAETRAKLGEAIKELTQLQINQIADGAEKFGNKERRVLLEVVQGEDALKNGPDAQLKFPDAGVTAQYIYYTEEQKEDTRLLMELRRIQYLQHVVMKQLEMTDRSGSSQVVQGMIAAGQKFVQGLTAVFKQVEALTKQIEKGLQNKAELPTAEQKTAAIAAITQAIRALPAVDPRHIAVKNMVMQQVERLQAKFNMVSTAPRASATILQMKAPVVEAKIAPAAKGADAAVKGDVKVAADIKTTPPTRMDARITAEAKTMPIAKGQIAEVRVDAKGQPIAPVTKGDVLVKTAPIATPQTRVDAAARIDAGVKASATGVQLNATANVHVQARAQSAPVAVEQVRVDAARQTPKGTTVTAISPNVSLEQAVARAAVVTSPVHTMQESLANALNITRPANGVTTLVASADAALQSTSVQTTPARSTPMVVQPVVQAVVQTPQHREPSVQQHVQPAGMQPTGAQPVVTQPVVTQVNGSQPIASQPVMQQTAAPIRGTQVSGTQVTGNAPIVAVQQGQAAVQVQTAVDTTVQPMGADTGAKGVEARSVPSGTDANVTKGQPVHMRHEARHEAREETRIEARQGDAKGGEAKAGDPKAGEAKTADPKEQKLPERPNDRAQEAKADNKDSKDKKDVKVESGCDVCPSKGSGCIGCKGASLTGNGSTVVQLRVSDQNVAEAKKDFDKNKGPCTGCAGCGPGGCSRTAADPNLASQVRNAALDKLAPRAKAAPPAPAPGKAA
ncbi:MAG: hypothetical protein SFW65_07710 [Alphaproteobacteria bacterium]|nr:hypothetical protein [Alphaproteobacteria bacterium]